MPIDIRCDFCGNIIEIKQTKAKTVSNETIKMIERACSNCDIVRLDRTWQEIQPDLDAEWERIAAEKRRFFENLLSKQRQEFFQQKKKEHYGSFHKE